MVARKQKAWSPIRVEGSGETPPLLVFCLLSYFPASQKRERELGQGGNKLFLFYFWAPKRESVEVGWGWSRKLGAGNDMEGEQGKMFWLYR